MFLYYGLFLLYTVCLLTVLIVTYGFLNLNKLLGWPFYLTKPHTTFISYFFYYYLPVFHCWCFFLCLIFQHLAYFIIVAVPSDLFFLCLNISLVHLLEHSFYPWFILFFTWKILIKGIILKFQYKIIISIYLVELLCFIQLFL